MERRALTLAMDTIFGMELMNLFYAKNLAKPTHLFHNQPL